MFEFPTGTLFHFHAEHFLLATAEGVCIAQHLQPRLITLFLEVEVEGTHGRTLSPPAISAITSKQINHLKIWGGDCVQFLANLSVPHGECLEQVALMHVGCRI
jgi:hypothetical protein